MRHVSLAFPPLVLLCGCAAVRPKVQDWSLRRPKSALAPVELGAPLPLLEAAQELAAALELAERLIAARNSRPTAAPALTHTAWHREMPCRQQQPPCAASRACKSPAVSCSLPESSLSRG